MKKIFGLLLSLMMLVACQDDGRKELMSQPKQEKLPDSIQVLKGEFVYGADAAVIRGENFVYGVTLDSMSKKLAEEIAPLKSDDFEMVPVTVKAKIVPNPEQEGWKEVIEIQQILEIPESISEKDTIENKKNDKE
ncbi:hypothetical protein [Christiangramia flava]|uniref:Uncharacterized protein n=1 Tax=Christiangramia flava JLT2011 TaxID=1229726 RepID=A0A1L7I2X5_9FLAO|nr:hypothetical protein [Christiangramia flava]APU67946.1 hypothetical protein GRFL_1222 [Christiangramia flava JLT2011]OSS40447.1 hypothetical protein C723_0755 [Christiangramia flava JLT2011]